MKKKLTQESFEVQSPKQRWGETQRERERENEKWEVTRKVQWRDSFTATWRKAREKERKYEKGRAERKRVKLKIHTLAHTSDFISSAHFALWTPLLFSYLTLIVPQILVFFFFFCIFIFNS